MESPEKSESKTTRKVKLRVAMEPSIHAAISPEIERLVAETSQLWLHAPLLLMKMIASHLFECAVFENDESLANMVYGAFSAASKLSDDVRADSRNSDQKKVEIYWYK